ncbi:MAG: hypothetical protein HRT47_05425 [Candidatus Caenarcaniphilales bacterium]|nr:hypothetical protein [Candidatus Caenarcaniphilales bacterium]
MNSKTKADFEKSEVYRAESFRNLGYVLATPISAQIFSLLVYPKEYSINFNSKYLYISCLLLLLGIELVNRGYNLLIDYEKKGTRLKL